MLEERPASAGLFLRLRLAILRLHHPCSPSKLPTKIRPCFLFAGTVWHLMLLMSRQLRVKTMNCRYWRVYGLLGILAVCCSTSSHADSMRCGQAIVKVGDSINTLLKKCGKPSDKFASRVEVNDSGLQRQTSVSNWVYRRTGQKDRVVSVYAGEVMKIGLD